MSLAVRKIMTRNPTLGYLFEVVIGDQSLWESPIVVTGGTFPLSVFETFTHQHGNSVKYYPGTYDVNNVDLEVLEFEDASVHKMFSNWRKRIVSPNDLYGIPNTYKRTLTVYGLIDLKNGKTKRVFGYRYENAFPISISDFQPAGDKQEINVFTVSFSVDGVSIIEGLN